MILVKRKIDRAMDKIVRNIKVQDSIKKHITTEVRRINNQLCYCVIIDTIVISSIPIEMFYTVSTKIIYNRVLLDVEHHVSKTYKERVYV